jgi:hypothetical protein
MDSVEREEKRRTYPLQITKGTAPPLWVQRVAHPPSRQSASLYLSEREKLREAVFLLFRLDR